MLQNSRYIRLKSLIVGYTLPKQWTRKVKLEKCAFIFLATTYGKQQVSRMALTRKWERFRRFQDIHSIVPGRSV